VTFGKEALSSHGTLPVLSDFDLNRLVELRVVCYCCRLAPSSISVDFDHTSAGDKKTIAEL
jgi:hypothetical protein